MKKYKLIVIGGGHAGIEAAYIANQLIDDICIITLPGIPLASAPCNPCVGGVGKGQVVRELDVLGGIMPELADLAGIQYRTLNESKGYAVQSTRVQIDKDKYSHYAEAIFSKLPIDIIRDKVRAVSKAEDLFVVDCEDSGPIGAQKIIVTVGTFLNGKLHTGQEVVAGGREGSVAVDGLSDIFSEVKTNEKRFKTGTPARLLKTSIDYSKMEEQPSDDNTLNFSFKNFKKPRNLKQVSCYLTRTNSRTMKFIRDNKHLSPMYNGQIDAVGARYCPSIEDKAYRYPDKDIHHVFVEPEGLDMDTVYPSGISSSLPKSVQEDFIFSIEGLENSKIKLHGYAVEYDVLDTTFLDSTLEYKDIPGLYFAGQVNGTSGYEEAAGQGYIAGLNAALKLLSREKFLLNRRESYIGVMIEDLISNRRDEPYRLFTARNENRLYVREDNAVLRIGSYRTSLGLFAEVDFYIESFKQEYFHLDKLLDTNYFNSDDKLINSLNITLSKRMNLKEILKQSTLDPIETLISILGFFGLSYNELVVRTVAINAKYGGYIERSNEQYGRVGRFDHKKIKWNKLVDSQNISFECKQRIKDIRPETFGQLKNINGIRPATLALVASTLT